jgi:glycosyltransferase involved in cell wall biosynthesis
MKHQYKASIIIPTYNRFLLLDYTLNSITKQTVHTDLYEVIVVDDGSIDKTKDVVDRYSDVLNLRYFYQNDEGYRVSSARNIGIKNALGEILIFIDSGVLLGSRCIEEHLRLHKNEKSCAVVGYVYGYDHNDTDHDINTLKKILTPYEPDKTIGYLREKQIYVDMRENLYAEVNDELNTLPAPWAMFLTCNASVSRYAIQRAGLFDENYNMNWGVEDLDLGYRLYVNDVKFKMSRHAESIHYPHESDMSEKFRQEIINKKYFNKKFNVLGTQLFLNSSFIDLNRKILERNKKSTLARTKYHDMFSE